MRVLVLGVGNVLLSDEGLGVKALEELKKTFKFPPNVKLAEGGTLGIDLLYLIEGFEKLLLIDAVLGGNPPGTLYKLKNHEVEVYLKRKVSAHELGLEEVLALAGMLGKKPKEVVLIGMEPERIEPSFELSHTVKGRLPLLLDEALKQLKEWGVNFLS
ncbi:MAG: HyaD/HybD family hydrogenase maturation endopeptidase [Aquificota bacterium]|nr:MAG: HyaD/HybD family hydrogenase maturation endopeptidase [Aquificota bacterium]